MKEEGENPNLCQVSVFPNMLSITFTNGAILIVFNDMS